MSEAAREGTVVHGIFRRLLGSGIWEGVDNFMECSVKGLGKLKWLLKQALCEFDIVGADIVDADYESSLVLLEHQNDV